MNAHNTIAGFYSKTDGTWTGFLRKSDGTLATFLPIDGGHTVVTGINASDTVIGYMQMDRGEQGFFRTAGGQVTYIGLSSYTVPFAINDKGQIAGSYLDNNHWRGFIRDADGTVNTFASPDGSILNVLAINNKGFTAGYYDDGAHAFFRTKKGTFTTFDVPTATYVNPLGITKDNVVAGYWRNGTSTHGFVRQADGTIESFDEPDAKPGTTFPSAINDDGIIVGRYTGTTNVHGFARSPSGTYVSLDAPGATHGTWIDHIAPNGKMAGHYIDTPNHQHVMRANKSLLSGL